MQCTNCLLLGHRAKACIRPAATFRTVLNVPDQPQFRDMAKQVMGRRNLKSLPADRSFEFPLMNFKKAGPTTAKNLKKKMHKQKRKKVWKEKKLAEERAQQSDKVPSDLDTMCANDSESVDEYSGDEEDSQ